MALDSFKKLPQITVGFCLHLESLCDVPDDQETIASEQSTVDRCRAFALIRRLRSFLGRSNNTAAAG